MSEDRMFREEELLADAAAMPALSSGLRMRVLTAAIEARDRRWQGRRALCVALVVFSFVGWAAWTGPLGLDARHTALTGAASLAGQSGDGQSGGESATGAGSSSYCRRDMLISAMGDDWRMVEAEFKSREEFTRRVQM